MTQDFDETLVPVVLGHIVISDTKETSKEEVGGLSDGRGDRLDQELPDLDRSVAPRPSTSSGQPPKRKGGPRREGSESR